MRRRGTREEGERSNKSGRGSEDLLHAHTQAYTRTSTHTSLLLFALLLYKLQNPVFSWQKTKEKQVISQLLKCLPHVKMATDVEKGVIFF